MDCCSWCCWPGEFASDVDISVDSPAAGEERPFWDVGWAVEAVGWPGALPVSAAALAAVGETGEEAAAPTTTEAMFRAWAMV